MTYLRFYEASFPAFRKRFLSPYPQLVKSAKVFRYIWGSSPPNINFSKEIERAKNLFISIFLSCLGCTFFAQFLYVSCLVHAFPISFKIEFSCQKYQIWDLLEASSYILARSNMSYISSFCWSGLCGLFRFWTFLDFAIVAFWGFAGCCEEALAEEKLAPILANPDAKEMAPAAAECVAEAKAAAAVAFSP